MLPGVLLAVPAMVHGAPAIRADESPALLRPVVGEERMHVVKPDETLHDVAYQYRLGFDAVVRLNPEVDPWLLSPGTQVRLPTRFILPRADAEGLVINIPEMRLFDFTGAEAVRAHAASIGDRENPTPIAEFRIGIKLIDPVWHVPESIRKEKPDLPDRLPPSEENPLGSRWMTLGATSYGIHGTNVRWSIGRPITHGCVRLYEDVMRSLFERIPEGTRVVIIYEPFKWGTDGTHLFLEAHPDVYGYSLDMLPEALKTPEALGLLDRTNAQKVDQVLQEARGVPVQVGSLEGISRLGGQEPEIAGATP